MIGVPHQHDVELQPILGCIGGGIGFVIEKRGNDRIRPAGQLLLLAPLGDLRLASPPARLPAPPARPGNPARAAPSAPCRAWNTAPPDAVARRRRAARAGSSSLHSAA